MNTEHTSDCVRYHDPEEEWDCLPLEGNYIQPADWAIEEATAHLGEGVPFCRVQPLAFDLDEEYEARRKAMTDELLAEFRRSIHS